MNENREYRIETNSEMFFLCLQYHGLRKFGLSEIIPGFFFELSGQSGSVANLTFQELIQMLQIYQLASPQLLTLLKLWFL